RPCGFGRQEFATLVGGSWTAYDHVDEFGVRVGDVVGKLDALAITSAAGSALALTWRGWPVEVTAHAVRHGVELRGNYEIHTPFTLTTLEAGGLGGRSSRAFVQSAFSAHQKRGSATARLAFDSDQHARASLRAAARLGGMRFAVSGEAGRRVALGGG